MLLCHSLLFHQASRRAIDWIPVFTGMTEARSATKAAHRQRAISRLDRRMLFLAKFSSWREGVTFRASAPGLEPLKSPSIPGVTPAKTPVTQGVTPGVTPGAMADGNPGCNPGCNPGFGSWPKGIFAQIRAPEIFFSKLALPTAQLPWEFAVSLFGNLE